MDFEQAIAAVLFLTVTCSYINYKFLKLPKSIGITLVSLIISSLINILSIFYAPINNYSQLMLETIGLDKTFLHGMLSFLLFAAAIHINPYELSKHKFAIASFATISVAISTILLGYFTYAISSLCNIHLPFYYCFVFAALISPTDAISVIGVLRTTKIAKSLEMKISGEALFNDGMSIALFVMALALAYGEERSINIDETVLYFLRQCIGGILFGGAFGWLAAKLINSIDDHELTIILTLALVPCWYIVATTVLKISGPISMVVTGLIIGDNIKRNSASNLSIHRVEDLWDLIDQILNAILFVLIGIEFVWIDINTPMVICATGIIIATLAARWISIYIPTICLSKLESFNSSVITIMTWGGLRGGISIALALSLTGSYRNTIVLITYFVVIFSIIVQGLTIRPLITKMKDKGKLIGII